MRGVSGRQVISPQAQEARGEGTAGAVCFPIRRSDESVGSWPKAITNRFERNRNADYQPRKPGRWANCYAVCTAQGFNTVPSCPALAQRADILHCTIQSTPNTKHLEENLCAIGTNFT